MRVIAIILSTWRPGTIVTECITAALNNPAISEVHVWGYDPTGENAHWKKTPKTIYHRALDVYVDKFTHDTLANGNKRAFIDDTKRIKWRAKLVLDMWAVLNEAQKLFPHDTLVYMENDAIIKPAFTNYLNVFQQSQHTSASCYGRSATTYSGSGTVCFFFKPGFKEVLKHLLAYHMVQPADFIISDYSQNKWPVYDAVAHGRPGKPHISTRLLSLIDT